MGDTGVSSKRKAGLGFLWTDLLIGIVTAGIAKTAAAPIERIHFLNIYGRVTTWKDIVKLIYERDGSLVFWRGHWTNLLRYSPRQAVNLAFKEKFKNMFGLDQKIDHGSLGWLFAGNMVSGGLAGALSLALFYPFDVGQSTRAAHIKCSPTEDFQVERRLGYWLREIVATDGLAGLYRRFAVSAAPVVVYRACYFGFYDSLKPILLTGNSLLASFALGYGVTISAQLFSYPLDMVRRRLMSSPGSIAFYKGACNCARRMLWQEGLVSFWKGSTARVNFVSGVAGAGTAGERGRMEKIDMEKRQRRKRGERGEATKKASKRARKGARESDGVLAGFDKLQELYMNWHVPPSVEEPHSR